MDEPWLSAAREPFDRRSAWTWLVEQARWRDEDEPSQGRKFPLKRGQVCHSLRYLARAWGWDDSKVRRFIAAAASAKALTFSTDAKFTLITISNYDEFSINHTVRDAHQSASVNRDRSVTDANQKEGKEESKSLPSEDAYVAQPDLLTNNVVPMPPDLPHEAMGLWNVFAKRHGLATVGLVSSSAAYQKRRTGLRRVLRTVGGLDGFQALLDRAGRSTFLRGDGASWRITLDFLCDRAYAVDRILEGKYDDRGSGVPIDAAAARTAASLAARERVNAEMEARFGEPAFDPTIIEHEEAV